jgi:hypothetical protein
MNSDRTMSSSSEQPSHSPPAPKDPPILRFSLRSLLIGMVVISVLLAVLVPSVQHLSRSAKRMGCQNNLKSIGLGLHNYYDVYKTYPCAITYAEDGTPMHSWRVLIDPFVEDSWLVYDFGEPWNGPNNRTFNSGSCAFWCRCPSASRTQKRECTNYVMLIDDRPGEPNGPPNRPGSVPPSFADRSAVIIIEIADSDIHWMEPRDVLLSELSMKINDRSKRSLSSYHGRACIAHADDTVELLDDAMTEELMRELLTQ